MCHAESPRLQGSKSLPNVPADPRGGFAHILGDAVKQRPVTGAPHEPGPGPGLGGPLGPSRCRRAKNRQKSEIGAGAPRDTVAQGGSDEDTPWEGRLRWG